MLAPRRAREPVIVVAVDRGDRSEPVAPPQRGNGLVEIADELLPVEAARGAEHAAAVRVGVEVEARHLGKQGPEMRRRSGSGEVLGDAEIGAAEHPDLAVAPGLGRDPFRHVVRVTGLRGRELAPAYPEGCAAAAGVDAHRHVAVPDDRKHPVVLDLDAGRYLTLRIERGAVVPGVGPQRGQRLLHRRAARGRPHDVDRQAHAVPHLHVAGASHAVVEALLAVAGVAAQRGLARSRFVTAFGRVLHSAGVQVRVSLVRPRVSESCAVVLERPHYRLDPAPARDAPLLLLSALRRRASHLYRGEHGHARDPARARAGSAALQGPFGVGLPD